MNISHRITCKLVFDSSVFEWFNGSFPRNARSHLFCIWLFLSFFRFFFSYRLRLTWMWQRKKKTPKYTTKSWCFCIFWAIFFGLQLYIHLFGICNQWLTVVGNWLFFFSRSTSKNLLQAERQNIIYQSADRILWLFVNHAIK